MKIAKDKCSDSVRIYSPKASLCAIGLLLQRKNILIPLRNTIKINQKSVIHSPTDKIIDAFIGILANIEGVVEINTKVRPDSALQLCFGRKGCADQSTIQATLSACTARNVGQMMNAVKEIYQQNSLGNKHPFRDEFLILDIDNTGLSCERKSDGALIGYQPRHGESIIRYGRQMCRVVAPQYNEIVVDRLYPGNIYLNHTAPWVLEEAEEILNLTKYKRKRTILRMDSGGVRHLDAFIKRGYQIHAKEHLPSQLKYIARNVKKWVPDPNNIGRELGWLDFDLDDYSRPIKRVVIRWIRLKDRQLKYSSLISTIEPFNLIKLVNFPFNNPQNRDELVLSYGKFYDQRAGDIEIDFKEDKQGLGIIKRSKKSFEAQQMMMMLNCLAHNTVVWIRNILAQEFTEFLNYGIKRFCRDIFSVPGFIEIDENRNIKSIILNENSPQAKKLASVLDKHLFPTKILISSEIMESKP